MRISRIAKGKNQNNYRLTKLNDLSTTPTDLQEDIKTLLESSGDRAHQTAGLFLWSILAHSRAIAILSRNDIQKLIDLAGPRLPEGSFRITSTRGTETMSIYGQLTGFLVSEGIIKILLNRNGNKPAVVEVIDPDFVAHLPEVTEEQRQMAIYSVTKGSNNSTIYQDNKSNKINNPTTLQDNNPNNKTKLTSQSEPQNELQKVNELNFEKNQLISKIRDLVKSSSNFDHVLKHINYLTSEVNFDIEEIEINHILKDSGFSQKIMKIEHQYAFNGYHKR